MSGTSGRSNLWESRSLLAQGSAFVVIAAHPAKEQGGYFLLPRLDFCQNEHMQPCVRI